MSGRIIKYARSGDPMRGRSWTGLGPDTAERYISRQRSNFTSK